MGKVISLINLQGTVGDYTFVKSRRYGDHIRAKRGTHKKAKLNKSFKEQIKKIPGANLHAKIFKDAINPYRRKWEDGTMWNRLISMFMKQFDVHGAFDFSKLEPFEIHDHYTLEKLINMESEIGPDKKRSRLHVNLSYVMHPVFRKKSLRDGYQLGVIGVFPDLKKKSAKVVSEYSNVISLSGKVEPFNIELPIPQGAKTFLVCVSIHGCSKGKPDGPMTTKGMRMIQAGELYLPH